MIVFDLIAIAILAIQQVVITNNRQNKADNSQPHTYIETTRLLITIVNFLILALVIISVPLSLYGIGVIGFPYIIQIVGLLIMAMGLLIRIISMRLLGKYYSMKLFVNDRQPLITKGIYGLIRHPIYLGDLLLFISIGIATNNYILMIVCILTTIPAFLIRIMYEERMMIENFGDEYGEYISKTKKLIPFVF